MNTNTYLNTNWIRIYCIHSYSIRFWQSIVFVFVFNWLCCIQIHWISIHQFPNGLNTVQFSLWKTLSWAKIWNGYQNVYSNGCCIFSRFRHSDTTVRINLLFSFLCLLMFSTTKIALYFDRLKIGELNTLIDSQNFSKNKVKNLQ